MSKADKRARKKERSKEAREARERAEKRSRQRKATLRVAAVAAIFAAAIGAFSIFGGDDEKVATDETTTTIEGVTCTDEVPETDSETRPTFEAAPAMEIDESKTYTATITTSCGDITVLLDAQTAPVATNNFVFLAREGFYDGLSFHRIATDFVVQGGDPDGNGSGGPGYSVPGEVPQDGIYPYGSLAAAKTGGEPAGTFGSQFFVVTAKEANSLPADYARFGLVTDGLDVLDKLASFYNPDQDPNDTSTQTPTRPLYIFSVEITEGEAETTTTGATDTTAAPTDTTAAPGDTTTAPPAETTTTVAG